VREAARQQLSLDMAALSGKAYVDQGVLSAESAALLVGRLKAQIDGLNPSEEAAVVDFIRGYIEGQE
jgi:hypothetical protein